MKFITERMALLSFPAHCTIGLMIRFILIVYGNYHDRTFSLPYTDIDYHVYTDASREIVNGASPYNRHTYRYAPILAAILTPNIFLHYDFGKILFSIIDVIVTILIKIILSKGQCVRNKCEILALAWLYNPLTIVVTTRGNADSLAVLLVLSTLYFMQKDDTVIAGIFHGISIHFRLYPIAFSLSMYLSLRDKHFFVPNVKQLKLVLACLLSLGALTAVSYYFYGHKYLYESMIYHLVRKDAKHNFSVFFYATYLSTGETISIFKRTINNLPQLILLVALSFRYSTKRELSFAMFAQAMIMVTYNSVMTSQYFFWFLSLLPLCLPDIRMSLRRWLVLTLLWFFVQGIWLFGAYYLEFHGFNMFYEIWHAGILFYLTNITILRDIINHYDSGVSLKSK